MYPTKIATCCYCGTRAALVLRGETRHELSCASCAAPLHELKMLRCDRSGPRDGVKSRSRQERPYRPTRAGRPKPEARTPKKGRRRKSLFKAIFEEAADMIEDIFD